MIKRPGRKQVIRTLQILSLLFLMFSCNTIIYLGRQAKGQLKVLREARPVESYLQDKSYPDSLKKQLQLIQSIREFTVDSLGLNKTGNYKKMYDQGGEPLLWTVNACQPYKLQAHQWWFPIIGSVSYKGFFDLQLAQDQADELEEEGLDVAIHEVAAWSTLGFLNDPILSSFLDRSPGRLANLVIHELTHGTLFVSSDVNFNESLASFIGDQGAIRWLNYYYGANSPELQEYLDYKADRTIYVEYVLEYSQTLDSMYAELDEQELMEEEKEIYKNRAIDQFVTGYRALPFASENYKSYFVEDRPNNVFFMHYVRYQAKGNTFREDLQNQYNGDIRAYIKMLKKKYRHVRSIFSSNK